MPSAPLRPCNHPGCPTLIPGGAAARRLRGKCDVHRRQAERAYRQVYDAATLYDRRWQRARKMFLAENPLCGDCQAKGLAVAAREVHHAIPHRGDREIFWQQEHWVALCKPCHSAHTAREVTARGSRW